MGNLAGRGGMTGTREKYRQDVRGGDSAAASGKSGIVTKNSFDGTFSDPAHSDLPRKISWVGNRDYQIDGADEDKKPWKVTVKALANGDIFFPDGNVWKKL